MITIGVSACLLGRRVRYDGGHKRHGWIADILFRHVRLVAVCPEVELGMGIPRETVRLVGSPDAPRLVGCDTGTDWTGRMQRYLRRRIRRDDLRSLDGFIFKSKSPSCALRGLPIRPQRGGRAAAGPGLFARALLAAYPLLPAEDELRLEDPLVRDTFITRVFCYRRLRELMARFSPERLARFHEAHTTLLAAHAPARLRTLAAMVAAAGTMARAELKRRYAAEFMAALARRPTVAKHAAVLRKLSRSLGRGVSDVTRQKLDTAIEEYVSRRVPLLVPQTLLKHYLELNGHPAARHVYLNPDPAELMLRAYT